MGHRWARPVGSERFLQAQGKGPPPPPTPQQAREAGMGGRGLGSSPHPNTCAGVAFAREKRDLGAAGPGEARRRPRLRSSNRLAPSGALCQQAQAEQHPPGVKEAVCSPAGKLPPPRWPRSAVLRSGSHGNHRRFISWGCTVSKRVSCKQGLALINLLLDIMFTGYKNEVESFEPNSQERRVLVCKPRWCVTLPLAVVTYFPLEVMLGTWTLRLHRRVYPDMQMPQGVCLGTPRWVCGLFLRVCS